MCNPPDHNNSSKSKRRSSVRANVKRNCSCYVAAAAPSLRKRTKSESLTGDTLTPEPASVPMKKATTASPTAESTEAAAPTTPPLTARPSKAMTKKYAQRKR